MEQSNAKPRRRRWHVPPALSRLIRLVAVAVVVEYLLVPQIAGTRNSWHLLLGANLVWIGVAAAAEILSLLTYAALTRQLLPRQSRPAFNRVLRIDLSTLAVSHVVPAGSAIGLGLGYRLLTSADVAGPDAATAKATQAVGSALVLNVILWIALVISIIQHGFTGFYGPVALAGILLLTAAVVLLFLLRMRREQTSARLARILGHLPRVNPATVSKVVCDAADYLDDFIADRRRLRQTVLLAAANWLFDAFALWSCVQAFGHTLGLSGVLVPYGIANVLAALPFTPAGLGVVEAFLIPALVGFSVPRGIAILGVLAWRAFNFLLPIPVGLAAYLTLPSTRHSDEEQATEG